MGHLERFRERSAPQHHAAHGLEAAALRLPEEAPARLARREEAVRVVLGRKRHAIVRGVERLSGAPVRASDVRAGAALVIAGLVADGETMVHDGEHVERGYPDLAGKLSALGADVERLD